MTHGQGDGPRANGRQYERFCRLMERLGRKPADSAFKNALSWLFPSRVSQEPDRQDRMSQDSRSQDSRHQRHEVEQHHGHKRQGHDSAPASLPDGEDRSDSALSIENDRPSQAGAPPMAGDRPDRPEDNDGSRSDNERDRR